MRCKSPAREQNVLHTEVSVVDALSMAVCQAIQQLRKQLPRLGLCHSAALAPASQASSARMLHLSSALPVNRQFAVMSVNGQYAATPVMGPDTPIMDQSCSHI